MTSPNVFALFVLLVTAAIQPIVRCAKLDEQLEHLETDEDTEYMDELAEVEGSEEFGNQEANETNSADEDIDEGAEVEGSPEPLSQSALSSLVSLIDADKDGRVSLPEILAYSRNFSKNIALEDVDAVLVDADKSNDGKLNLDEYLAAAAVGDDQQEGDEIEHKRHIEAETANFHAADEDGDKLLDKAEVLAVFYTDTNDRLLDIQAARRLNSSDKNGDGKLSFAELFHTDVQTEEGEQDMLHEQFRFMDTDGDGLVNAADIRYMDTMHLDAQMAMRDMFDAVDSDKDKQISLNELVARHSDILHSDAYNNLIQWASHHEL